MSAVKLRFAFISVFLLGLGFSAGADCVDTVLLKIQPVQCHGLRNGVIEVTEVLGGHAPYYYSLDGQNFSTRPVIDLLWAGEYVLYVRDSSGCVKTFPVLVTEPDELTVKLTTNDSSVVSGQWVQIAATVYPAGSALTKIQWRPLEMFPQQNKLQQLARVVKDSDISIEITNTAGCTATDQLTIPTKRANLYFPNVLDPDSNQDNYFTVLAGEGVQQIRLMQVFNRAGQLVFEQRNFAPNDPQQGWNGRSGNRMSPSGVYTWLAVIEFLDGRKEHFSGSVTLVR